MLNDRFLPRFVRKMSLAVKQNALVTGSRCSGNGHPGTRYSFSHTNSSLHRVLQQRLA